MAYGILDPWPETKPVPLALAAQSPNHWTTREVPGPFFDLANTQRIGVCWIWALSLGTPGEWDDGDPRGAYSVTGKTEKARLSIQDCVGYQGRKKQSTWQRVTSKERSVRRSGLREACPELRLESDREPWEALARGWGEHSWLRAQQWSFHISLGRQMAVTNAFFKITF